MVPQKGWWGAGRESAGQRASFTTPATSSSAPGPPQSRGLCACPRPGRPRAPASRSAPPLCCASAAPLGATCSPALGDDTCCGKRRAGFSPTGPRRGRRRGVPAPPPPAPPAPDPAGRAPGRPALPSSGGRARSPLRPGLPYLRRHPTPREPELSSGTSGPHLHMPLPPENPPELPSSVGVLPRPAALRPLTPLTPLTMMRGRRRGLLGSH